MLSYSCLHGSAGRVSRILPTALVVILFGDSKFAPGHSARSSMSIATETQRARTPSGVPCGGYGHLHFTPDGVSRPPARVTINIPLLTEGCHQLRWWDYRHFIAYGLVLAFSARVDFVLASVLTTFSVASRIQFFEEPPVEELRGGRRGLDQTTDTHHCISLETSSLFLSFNQSLFVLISRNRFRYRV